MSFFTTLYNSLYNFKWLRDQKNSFSWAWSYFFLLIFLVSGLSAISLGVKYFDVAPKIKQTIYNEVPEFQAEIKNGELQINGIDQPYIKKYENLVMVVDTVSTSSINIKSFSKDDSPVLLVTRNAFEVYNAGDKSVKSQAVKDFGDYKTDRAGMLKNADFIFSSKMIWILTFFSFVLLFLFLSFTNLLNILFFSLLFYFVIKQQKLNWKFKELFTVGLFVVTLPLLLSQAITGVYMNWVFVMIFVAWMYMVIFKKDIAV